MLVKSRDREGLQLIQMNASSSSSLQARLLYDNGSTFDGMTLHGKRHGRGTYINSAAGFEYMGEFHGDLAHGMGEATYQISEEGSDRQITGQIEGKIESKYHGEWVRGQRSGYGELETSAGDRFEGLWAADQPSQGRWTFPDASWYEGEYSRGARSMGTHSSADGRETYRGGFKGPDREGSGLLQIEGLYEYKGGFKRNMRQGEGECRFGLSLGAGRDAGGLYVGSWDSDVRSGQGEMKWPSGEVYSGSWANDVRQGEGTCDFSNGDRYAGAWADDRPHGKGRMATNGEKYEGDFLVGKRHGFGRAFFSDGSTFTGRWEDDCWVQSAADPARTLVQIGQRVTAGAVGEATIVARDTEGHLRITGGDVFVVGVAAVVDVARVLSPEETEAEGLEGIEGQVEDLGDGRYQCKYEAPRQAGIYRVSIKAPRAAPLHKPMVDLDAVAGDEMEGHSFVHCADSPYLLRVVPDNPDPKKLKFKIALTTTAADIGSDQEPSILKCNGGLRVYAGRSISQSLQIEARDRFGNLCKGAKSLSLLQLKGRIVGGSNGQEVFNLTLVPCPSKGYIGVEFEAPLIPGLYRVEIETLHGSATATALDGSPDGFKHMPGSPFSLTVCPPEFESLVLDQKEEWKRPVEVDWGMRVDEAMKGWEADDKGGDEARVPAQRGGGDKEDEFSAKNPAVPIVDRLEDLWMLGNLQALKKKRDGYSAIGK